VLPLLRKDGHPETARESTRSCAAHVRPSTTRAARSAAATGARTRSARRSRDVDHQSLEDRTVTVRERDSLQQERVAIDALAGHLQARLDPDPA
jgi:glycyl-tRNA synthetase